MASLWKPIACGQTVLPDRSLLIRQKFVENAKIQKYKCAIVSNFQILLSNRPSSMCPSRFKLNYQKRFRIFTFLKYDSGSLLLKAVNQQFIVASIKKMTTFVQLLWDLVNKLLNKKNYT